VTSVLFCLNVVLGLAGLIGVNVAMFSCLRRVTTLTVMLLQYILMHTIESYPVQGSIYLTVIGALVAGLGDLTFDLYSYVLIFLNCLVTAFYLVSIKLVQRHSPMTEYSLLYYISITALPVASIFVILSGELTTVIRSPHWTDLSFLSLFFLSGVQGLLINYSIYLCTNVNSPLATSITGQIKNVVTTFVGMIAFGDFVYTPLNAAGLSLGLLGSVLYSWLKLVESRSK